VTACGDRFLLIRIDSKEGRSGSSLRAVKNTGDEVKMRQELAAAAGGLIGHASKDDVRLPEPEIMRLVKAADIVTMARTAVERDYRGDVVFAHAPEMPTRFVKQLAQLVRGAVAIGMSRDEAMRLAIRCARDSIPPLRLEILLDVAANPGSRPSDVRKRIGQPWSTTKREMEAMHLLRILTCDEETEQATDGEGKITEKTRWRYRLGDGYDRETLLAMVGPPAVEPNVAAPPPIDDEIPY
jgi:hypothetical protein